MKATKKQSAVTEVPATSDLDFVKKQFSEKLENLLLDKGWNQSELARRAGLKRDAVSTYCRQRSLPDPINLRKLCQALGVKPNDLLPAVAIGRRPANEPPTMMITDAPGQPGKVYVRVNRVVDAKIASEIYRLVEGL